MCLFLKYICHDSYRRSGSSTCGRYSVVVLPGLLVITESPPSLHTLFSLVITHLVSITSLEVYISSLCIGCLCVELLYVTCFTVHPGLCVSSALIYYNSV
ncbi:hypothetical protein DPEC_G00187340 [Dallia pectoralis]|uniref:Uncharacterized protein n=1 Tax=Dallia pectoralis TaxID=75939 RepID=A0ACC2GC08_DALPE|nr:hypothetical protein DPEC_G00187340 [Dallia pectoralis]